MSEPQARSTLGTRWRSAGFSLPSLAALLVAVGVISTPLSAQIRGRAPVARSNSAWWFSAGAGAVSISNVNDGATASQWRFGSDPLWQMRGTLERSSDEFTSIGVAVAYGLVDVTVAPLSGVPLPSAPTNGTTGGVTPLPTICATSCAAQTQLWSVMGQFRSGGGTGFHTLFEATGGVTGFRNMRTRDSTATPIGKPSGATDLSGAIGLGFGYPLSRGLVITFVQDVGMGWHSKADLPSGTGRTWRSRTTRASLRFSF